VGLEETGTPRLLENRFSRTFEISNAFPRFSFHPLVASSATTCGYRNSLASDLHRVFLHENPFLNAARLRGNSQGSNFELL
jgi:hypothetical protein